LIICVTLERLTLVASIWLRTTFNSRSRNYFIQGWFLWRRKKSVPAGNRIPVVQSTSRHFTRSAIPAWLYN